MRNVLLAIAFVALVAGRSSAQRLSPQGGTVSSVTGLPGGGVTVTGSNARPVLSVDMTVGQHRVTGTCAPGSSIRAIAQDGTVTCETDDGVTYTANQGLVLTGTTFGIRGDCSTNDGLKWNGTTWVCTSGPSITGSGTAGRSVRWATASSQGVGAWADDGTNAQLGGTLTVTRDDGGSHTNRPLIVITNTASTGSLAHRAELQFNSYDASNTPSTSFIRSEGATLTLDGGIGVQVQDPLGVAGLITATLGVTTPANLTTTGAGDLSIADDATIGDSITVNGQARLAVGTAKDVIIGRDTTAATNAENGFRINPASDGNVYLDAKTITSGTLRFRGGAGAESGGARTWLTVDPATMAATFSGPLAATSSATITGQTSIGTSSPDANAKTHVFLAAATGVSAVAAGTALALENSGTLYQTLKSPGEKTLLFANATSNSDGRFGYDSSTNLRGFHWNTAGALRMTLDASGNLNTTGAITEGGVAVLSGTITANTLAKGSGGNLANSLVTDDGTTLAYNTNKFTVASATGNAAVGGTLSAGSHITGGGNIFTGSSTIGLMSGSPSIDFFTATNSDNQTGWINKRGYNNGVTRDRNLSIGDGKDGAIATFTGSNKATSLAGALTAAGDAALQANVTLGTGTINTVSILGSVDRHVSYTGTAPSASCGPIAYGNDMRGAVAPSSGTSCSVTFANAFDDDAVSCVATVEDTKANYVWITALDKNHVAFAWNTALSVGGLIHYHCDGTIP